MQDSIRFLSCFFLLFLAFYGFNIAFIGLSTPGGIYISWLDEHFNYIKLWRKTYLWAAAKILEWCGYNVYIKDTSLKVTEHSGFRLVYSCLGYGIMSFFAAFVLSFPKPIRSRLIFLFTGLTLIFVMNLIRFVLIPLVYKPQINILSTNHHDIFNCLLYSAILWMIYHWVQRSSHLDQR